MPTKLKLSPLITLIDKPAEVFKSRYCNTRDHCCYPPPDSAFHGVIYSPKGMAISIGVGPGVPQAPPPFPLGREHPDPSRALKGGGGLRPQGDGRERARLVRDGTTED